MGGNAIELQKRRPLSSLSQTLKTKQIVFAYYKKSQWIPALGILQNAKFRQELVKGKYFHQTTNFLKDTSQVGVANIEHYNTIIYLMVNDNKLEEAFQVFKNLQKDGIKADTQTYNIIIDG